MKTSISSKIVVLLTYLVFPACQDDAPPPPQSAVCAKVGDQLITAEMFKKSYETAFAHLKTGEDRKMAILDLMIRERALAAEGIRNGLQSSPAVRQAEQRLRRELAIEALIEKDIKSRIKVTSQEIQEAINKSKVSFKFRYWVEQNRETAISVAARMRQQGYAEVLDDLLKERTELALDPALFESEYLTYLDISPEILTAIQDLPYGDISDPVMIDDHYYIFQVMDIRRKGVTTTEYASQASRFEQIVFYQKLTAAVPAYISQLLEPKNIVTNRRAFNLLASAVEEWQQNQTEGNGTFSEALKNAADDDGALGELRSQLEQPLTTFDGGSLSYRDILEMLDISKVKATYKNRGDLRSELHHRQAWAIRDFFLHKQAVLNGLDTSEAVESELSLWRNYWVYQAARDSLLRHHNPPGDWQQSDSFIRDASEKFMKKYGVEIYRHVLDTISVVDFAKSRWATMQTYRTGSNRLAYPMVDPAWVMPQGATEPTESVH